MIARANEMDNISGWTAGEWFAVAATVFVLVFVLAAAAFVIRMEIVERRSYREWERERDRQSRGGHLL